MFYGTNPNDDAPEADAERVAMEILGAGADPNAPGQVSGVGLGVIDPRTSPQYLKASHPEWKTSIADLIKRGAR